jgi:predicted AAA+ superfamily ATPase
MIIKRAYNLDSLITSGKALIIYGPRRTGKTTLLNNFLANTTLNYKLDSGDNIRIQHILSSQDFNRIIEYASGYNLIAIDEAQQIPNIGMGLKIIIDQNPQIMIIATGSSSFDLAGAVGEPLTGRKRTIILYPLAQHELLSIYNRFELRERLDEFLVFGSYPEIITAKSRKEKIVILNEIVNSYLLKDILSLDRIKGSRILLDLLKLIAFQIGSEVSLNELATQVRLDVKTIGRYLDIFEKAFIIKRINGFSRNLRKEITSKAKYFFLDNGIRNAVISQFNMPEDRDDNGRLWENFIIAERMKKCALLDIYGDHYFWRTYDGQELDWVEEREGKLFGYEMKYSLKKKKKIPGNWIKNYRNAEYHIITLENYLDFIL